MAAANFIPYLYRFLKPRLPEALWEGDRNSNKIALTFDDGPHPQFTPPLLKVLEQYDVQATFFWLGSWVKRYPDIARQVYEGGHQLALHGFIHKPFLFQNIEEIRQGLEATQDAIATVCPEAPTPIDVRPPYGICRAKTIQQLHKWGYRTVMWSVVPIDWTEPGVEVVQQRVLKQTQGGDLIVLHDGSSGGQAVANCTREIVPKLLKQGFEFISVDTMWEQRILANPI
ncbi:MAG: polysaccharide deacetylase family protein [Acaryochloridaceae cyanobacterium RL_2_7]|nr:polysaccharide deacetylase family protein [Acaryochloridaceae cyanobacterium RL_2_7]